MEKIIMLAKPEAPVNIIPPVSGTYKLFLDSTNSNQLSKMDSTGAVTTVILPPATSATVGTGILYGGKITWVDATHISITAGAGIIAEQQQDGTTLLTPVTWTAIPSLVIPVGSGLGHYLFIDPLGSTLLTVANNPVQLNDVRENIYLGLIGHSNGTSITAISNAPIPAYNIVNTVYELAQGIGPFSWDGNTLSLSPADFSMSIAAGLSFQMGGNLATELNLPNTITTSGLTTPILNLVKSTAFLGPGTNQAPVFFWDNSGTLTAISTTHHCAAHRIWFQPTTNKLYFQYGQAVYTTKTQAKNGYSNEVFVTPTNLTQNCYLVAVVIVGYSAGVTTWDSDSLIPQSKFASKGGGGTGAFDTCQSTYTNSLTPKIRTDAIRGAFNIMAGVANTDNQLEIGNLSDVVTFSVDGNGKTTVSSLVVRGAYTLPTADGAAGKVLTSHANGLPTWETPSAGAVSTDSTLTGNGTPGAPLSVVGGSGTTTNAASRLFMNTNFY
jgi:hypothetical protein